MKWTLTDSSSFEFQYLLFLNTLAVHDCAYVTTYLIRIVYTGDAIEAKAIKTTFADHASSSALAFSSTKVRVIESCMTDNLDAYLFSGLIQVIKAFIHENGDAILYFLNLYGG